MRQTTKNFEKISNFQMKFHQTRYHLSKDIRQDMESPWSVDFKTTFNFEFMTYSGVEMGCQRYFMIQPKCAKTQKIAKYPRFSSEIPLI